MEQGGFIAKFQQLLVTVTEKFLEMTDVIKSMSVRYDSFKDTGTRSHYHVFFFIILLFCYDEMKHQKRQVTQHLVKISSV
jgi:hypothetical protein